MNTAELTKPTTVDATQFKNLVLIWLCSFGFHAAADGRFANLVCAILAWSCLLHMARLTPPIRGSLLGFLAISISFPIAWWGLIPVPIFVFAPLTIGFALVISLPLLIDGWLRSKIPHFGRTLILPLSAVIVLYSQSVLSPYGTWGVYAYSFHGYPYATQLLSITGLWGLVFLMFWSAAVLQTVFACGWSSKAKVIVLLLCAWAGVLGMGQLRTTFFVPQDPTVRIASITVDRSLLQNAMIENDFQLNQVGEVPQAVAAELDRTFDDLFELTERELMAGARLVFWSEVAGSVRAEDLTDVLHRVASLAQQYQAYVVPALNIETQGKALSENVVLVVNPSGNVETTYNKSTIVPGDSNIAGDGIIPIFETDFGRIALAICFDLDFPSLMRQLSSQRADILLAPSNDWFDIDPYHTRMAEFRAIENGVSLIRQTDQGRSIAVDYHGTVLAQVDAFKTLPYTMVAHVPTKGINTVYGMLGDWLVWVAFIALCGLYLAGFKIRRRRPSGDSLDS